MMTDLISAEILKMDVIKKGSVKIALRFTIYLLYDYNEILEISKRTNRTKAEII